MAEVAGERDTWPPAVLVGVVEAALLVVVLSLDVAGVDLELGENEVLVEVLLEVLGVVGAMHDVVLQLIGRKHCQIVPRKSQWFLHREGNDYRTRIPNNTKSSRVEGGVEAGQNRAGKACRASTSKSVTGLVTNRSY